MDEQVPSTSGSYISGHNPEVFVLPFSFLGDGLVTFVDSSKGEWSADRSWKHGIFCVAAGFHLEFDITVDSFAENCILILVHCKVFANDYI
jgi:hypothetical protein